MVDEKLKFKFSITIEAVSLMEAEIALEEILLDRVVAGDVIDVFDCEEVK